MMANLGLEPLEKRRWVSRLAFLYKILHVELAIPADELGTIRNSHATCHLATSNKLIVPRCETTQLRKHFVAKITPVQASIKLYINCLSTSLQEQAECAPLRPLFPYSIVPITITA